MLRRALEVNAPELPRGRKPMPPRIGAELLIRCGQILIGPMVVETERRCRGQRYHMVALALRRDGYTERHLVGASDGRLYEVHPLRDVRAVEPHSLQRDGAKQRRALRHRGRRIHAAVDRLPRQKNAPDLRRRVVRALAELFDVAVQLVAQCLQPSDELRQVNGIVKIPANFIQRQVEVLKDADGADLGERVDGVITVPGGALLDVRLHQTALLVVEQDAAGDADGLRDLADREQIRTFPHKVSEFCAESTCIAPGCTVYDSVYGK